MDENIENGERKAFISNTF